MWSIVALAFIATPIAELRAGTTKTVILFFLGDWLSTVSVLIGDHIAGSDIGRHPSVRDAGSSSGAWALTVLIVWTISNRRFRNAALGATGAFLVLAVLWHHRPFDTQHLVAFAAALLVLFVMDRRESRTSTSDGETDGVGHGRRATVRGLSGSRRPLVPAERRIDKAPDNGGGIGSASLAKAAQHSREHRRTQPGRERVTTEGADSPR